MIFVNKSSKYYIKNQETFCKFNPDSSFLCRTTIDKKQEAKAGYKFELFKGQWQLKDGGKVISIKVDRENNFRDTYQIEKLTADSLVVKLLIF
ncbi:hypothetical protein GCM10027043_52790 [Ferruginibacter profundus]